MFEEQSIMGGNGGGINVHVETLNWGETTKGRVHVIKTYVKLIISHVCMCGDSPSFTCEGFLSLLIKSGNIYPGQTGVRQLKMF